MEKVEQGRDGEICWKIARGENNEAQIFEMERTAWLRPEVPPPTALHTLYREFTSRGPKWAVCIKEVFIEPRVVSFTNYLNQVDSFIALPLWIHVSRTKSLGPSPSCLKGIICIM